MRIRVLIGLVLALLVVVAVVVYPWRSSDSPSGPNTPSADDARPVVGAEGIGDPYFPRAGNGGYDVTGYDIQIRYDPATGRLEGNTTITALATESLSRFNLDLRLAASAVTVDDRPAEIRHDGGELQVTPAQPVLRGQPMVVRVNYAGVPSDISYGAEQPWMRTVDGALALGEPDSAAWWYPSNDHPSDKATVAVTATVPAGVEAISNGALLGGPEP
ncbi:MAG TPA: M1 family peptidase, partial [Pseudonocardiaceae bacterium]|nr:M1 family peptidase [Pseudonocardiaceae bacterium]